MTTHDPMPWETTTSPPDPMPTGPFVETPERADDDRLHDLIATDQTGLQRQIRTAADRLAVEEILDQLSGNVPATAQFTASTRDSIADAIRARAARRAETRPEVVEDAGDLRAELVGAADDADVLDRLAAGFVEGAKLSRLIARDLVAEIPERRGKPVRTAHVGDGQGSRLTVTTAQPTEAFAELDEIVDVVGTATIAEEVGTEPTYDTTPGAYADGVRAGMAALLAVLASPKVKTTALDELRARLQDAGEDALAKRLRKSYGRRDKGEPTVKIERTPLDEEKGDDA